MTMPGPRKFFEDNYFRIFFKNALAGLFTFCCNLPQLRTIARNLVNSGGLD